MRSDGPTGLVRVRADRTPFSHRPKQRQSRRLTIFSQSLAAGLFAPSRRIPLFSTIRKVDSTRHLFLIVELDAQEGEDRY
ncbi:hypothetical protein Rcae01_00638 [Novipirellula caenicola]|uniref:Uncharacterized protein n=1 Tax=Novipirellula caenicola TaxID=1536901 RepID=A0ABP9VJ16_9BACT